jgi:DNA modification methylase
MKENEPARQIEQLSVNELRFSENNSRTHSGDQIEQIAASIREFGFTNPVLIDADGIIIAGHGRVLAARAIGLSHVPCLRLDYLTDTQKRAYIIADNRLALNAGWDETILGIELADLQALDFDIELTGFSDAEFGELLNIDTVQKERCHPDELPEKEEAAVSKRGDIWVLGKHRVMCGDATISSDVNAVLAGVTVDIVCTDPPYCSGGFQESGKSAGSVGSAAPHKKITNDRLSTRGYQALLKTAFSNLAAQYLYAFTDWRMWIYLFDIVESSGYGVRSMIVWDKGTPGMGRGWRSQHELIMWGCQKTPPFSKHASGAGNVLHEKRTGNIHHTTEKPVDIIESLLSNTPFANVVADPFNGSGTTLIACERLGRIYRGIELDPLYVDTTVRRWQQYTGKKALHADTGEAFPG